MHACEAFEGAGDRWAEALQSMSRTPLYSRSAKHNFSPYRLARYAIGVTALATMINVSSGQEEMHIARRDVVRSVTRSECLHGSKHPGLHLVGTMQTRVISVSRGAAHTARGAAYRNWQ